MQESSQNRKSGFFWENPQCQTIYNHQEGKLALEVINDFLEFFRMDYTHSIFASESNLQDAARKDDLLRKLGVKGDTTKPVLFHILNALQRGDLVVRDQGASSSNSRGGNNQASSLDDSDPKTGGRNIVTNLEHKDFEKKDNTNSASNQAKKNKGFPSLDEDKNSGFNPKGQGKLAGLGSSQSPQNLRSGSDPFELSDEKERIRLAEAENKLRNLGDPHKIGELSSGDKKVPKVRQPSPLEDDDEYADEVFENVDEEIEGDYEPEDEESRSRSKNNFLQSTEDIAGASQSQGFDVSVDSLALEEYDHVEEAERI